jgi:hypothetical protein
VRRAIRSRRTGGQEFHRHGPGKTERDGVSLFVSLLERRVIVLGDEGIHAKSATTTGPARRSRPDLATGKLRDASSPPSTVAAKPGRALPAKRDDVNELADRVIVRREARRRRGASAATPPPVPIRSCGQSPAEMLPKRPCDSRPGPDEKKRTLCGPAGPSLPNARPHNPSIWIGWPGLLDSVPCGWPVSKS